VTKKSSKTKGFNRERAARVLAEATYTTDAKAARAHGVSAATVAAWRTRCETDPELARLYADALRRLDGAWVDETRLLLLDTVRAMRKVLPKMTDPEALPDLLAVLREAGGLLVQREALVWDGLDADATDRAGGAGTSYAASTRQGTPTQH
jgi:hypothetical protein